MAHNDKGEHSRNRDQSNDEKPLKKARYEWEVKGKSHLKESNKNASPVENVNNNNVTVKTFDKQNKTSHVSNSNWQRCFLADMVSDEDEWSNRNIDESILNEIPVTLVSPNPKNIDYYLRRWQARRIARGVVDNTINTILETWINPPIDFDATDLIENCENNGQVEDDGILMAIQSHGLQSTFGSSLSVLHRPETNKKDNSLEKPHEFSESSLDNFKNYQNELIKEGVSTSSNSQMHNPSIVNQETNECDTLQLEDPMDFLNAAVSAAIEKKGLSSCNF